MDEFNDTYAVLEIQSNGASLTVTPFSFTSWEDALQKFYQLMVYVVSSAVPEHTVLIMDKVGQIRKSETIYHSEEEE